MTWRSKGTMWTSQVSIYPHRTVLGHGQVGAGGTSPCREPGTQSSCLMMGRGPRKGGENRKQQQSKVETIPQPQLRRRIQRQWPESSSAEACGEEVSKGGTWWPMKIRLWAWWSQVGLILYCNTPQKTEPHLLDCLSLGKTASPEPIGTACSWLPDEAREGSYIQFNLEQIP